MAKVSEFEIEGLRAVIFKHDRMGHLCGYLGLPDNHPLYGKHYDHESVPQEVHGGWTYSEDRAPQEETDGRWYLGFDCAHLGDLVPGIRAHEGDTYKDEAFVSDELKAAATHLVEMAL